MTVDFTVTRATRTVIKADTFGSAGQRYGFTLENIVTYPRVKAEDITEIPHHPACQAFATFLVLAIPYQGAETSVGVLVEGWGDDAEFETWEPVGDAAFLAPRDWILGYYDAPGALLDPTKVLDADLVATLQDSPLS